jgi:hypothetical protein
LPAVAGSSKAWVQVSPFILDTALRLNTYNLGLDGHQFKAQYMRHRFYEQFNRQPTYIIHAVDLFTLTKRKDLYMPEQFAPYLADSIIANGTKDYIGYTSIDYFNPFTKYQYRNRTIGIGLLELFNIKHYASFKYKGYEGHNEKWDLSFDNALRQNRDGWAEILDDSTVKLFDIYLDECKRKGIKMVMFYPPEYIEAQHLITNRKEIISLYQHFSEKYDIPFLDYSNDELSYSTKYFYNSQHLNRTGAELFTAKLAVDLMEIATYNGPPAGGSNAIRR